MNIPNFKIQAQGTLSLQVLDQGIHTFGALCNFIRHLPYTRISDKNNLSLTLSEHCGTCSSKHAFLKQIAIEQEYPELELTVGIFKMNASNTPVIQDILVRNDLEYLPEAHCYLSYNKERYDYTKPDVDVNHFKDDILLEKGIQPKQVGHWKTQFHKDYILNWIEEYGIASSLEDIWNIREQCIQALANHPEI